MLKLMKYEFRKMRTILLILIAGAAGLQIAFMIGNRLGDDRVVGLSVTLLTLLAFVVYFYILAAGFLSYSRELSDKTGYMAFMTPVSPLALIGSKLLFTALTALAVTALFGGAAWYDFNALFKDIDLGGDTLRQMDRAFVMITGGATGGYTFTGLLLRLGFMLGSVLISVMLFMCTAYLAITLGTTILQSQKGFLRGVVTFAIFIGLNILTNRVTTRVGGMTELQEVSELMRSLGVLAAVELAFAVAFALVSAWLLDKKVSL